MLLSQVWGVFLQILKFLCFVTLFLLFAYVEILFESGWVVAAGLALYLLRRNCILLPILGLIIYAFAGYLQAKPIYVATFVLLESVLFQSSNHKEDDTKVSMKPHETEIRSLLYRSNPAKLHKVDNMLVKYQGRELELLTKLQREVDEDTTDNDMYAQNESPTSPFEGKATSGISQEKHDKNHDMQQGKPFGFNLSASSISLDRLSPQTSYREHIVSIFERYDPSQLQTADKLLNEYSGRENVLLEIIMNNYGLSSEDLSEDYVNTTATRKSHLAQRPSPPLLWYSSSHATPMHSSGPFSINSRSGSGRAIAQNTNQLQTGGLSSQQFAFGQTGYKATINQGFNSTHSNTSPATLLFDSGAEINRVGDFRSPAISDSVSGRPAYRNPTIQSRNGGLLVNTGQPTNKKSVFMEQNSAGCSNDHRSGQKLHEASNIYGTSRVEDDKLSVVEKAKRDAYLDMQARINARFGPH